MEKTKCPTCASARFHGAPAGYLFTKVAGLFKRCETCTGHGIASRAQIMGWELSL